MVNKDSMLVLEELMGLKRSHSSDSPYAAVLRAEQKLLFLHHHLTSHEQYRALPLPGLSMQGKGETSQEASDPRRDPSRVNSSPLSTLSETCSSAAQECPDPVHCPVLLQVLMADAAPH